MTVLILVPAGCLFAWVWNDNQDRRDNTQRERQGVEYLTALAPLISGLAEAQSSALQGVAAPPASLTTAVTNVSAVDARLGAELGTRERWTNLRDKIGKFKTLKGDAEAVFQAHVEVADLALALYASVQSGTGLLRDPDNDVSHLQQVIAVDLPTTVTQVSRMGDLAMLVSAATPARKAVLAPQFGASVEFVNASVDNLTNNLQAAAENTTSTTLSGNLVSTLDQFRRGVEALTRGANPGGTPNPATMATAQAQLQTSLSALSGVVSRETTTLLDDRLDSLDLRHAGILTAGVAVLALTLVAGALHLVGRRRASSARPGPAPAGPDAARGMGRPGDGYGHLNQAPTYGDAPTQRERSGVLR
ncbi:hypothetical protein [Krasilnikovia cinnamomea]|uniref:hypothetical protein n=1 Tax=Krasilnikovia cinnamomea TaxID=349313 RepID=UPI001F5EA20C|nr:hypothetical protein [Krasilnikovia cinnamomea]